MTLIRVLLVDDNPEFLEAAENFLAIEPDLEIVGRALSGRQGVTQVNQLQPDLVLLDLAMPDMSGLEVMGLIKAQPGPPRVVIVTLHDTPDYRTQATAASADGFVPKSEFGTQLLPLISTLFA